MYVYRALGIDVHFSLPDQPNSEPKHDITIGIIMFFLINRNFIDRNIKKLA